MIPPRRLRIAVVGTGISGLSAAWMLDAHHDLVVYERAERTGGHSNTVRVEAEGRSVPVDTGFIVFNRKTYPNLTALFAMLQVPTQASDMSFGVSLDGGTTEYSGCGLGGLFGQPVNLLRPRFWSMITDLVRFYGRAPREAAAVEGLTLGEYLARGGYGAAFRDDHLLPMAAAIWSTEATQMLAYPAAAFIRFHDNHGLLQLRNRPVWETVTGGSRAYVDRLTAGFAPRIRRDCGVTGIQRAEQGVIVTDMQGRSERFDHVVIATHADQGLALLSDPSPCERRLLGAFRYSRNHAVLHSDESFMPRRRRVWASWNYVGARGEGGLCVTYWMNRLQGLASERPLFVTLNPPRAPRAGTLLHSEVYEHPIFDTAAMAAQRELWSLQGARDTWYCGAYFGAGFHEDGLQAGLAVAEQLGGVRRPWRVPEESGRIVVTDRRTDVLNPDLAA
jgi:predicted NAD/FAD-binding protein